MFIKRDIYKYEFYLCNILKMDANCRSILFVTFFLLSQIVVNVFGKMIKRTFHVHLHVSSQGFMLR